MKIPKRGIRFMFSLYTHSFFNQNGENLCDMRGSTVPYYENHECLSVLEIK